MINQEALELASIQRKLACNLAILKYRPSDRPAVIEALKQLFSLSDELLQSIHDLDMELVHKELERDTLVEAYAKAAGVSPEALAVLGPEYIWK